jgi:aminoglycoside phosphotransferase (APT) family kinase protein
MNEQRPATPMPWRRDLNDLAAGLASWAGSRGTSEGAVTNVRAPESGMANETVLFRVDGEPLVARLAPLPGTPLSLFPNYDLDLQRRCMELVKRHTKVPVPEVVLLESSEEWLGAPFLVLRAVEGVVPLDNPPYPFTGWLLDADEDDRLRLEERSIAILVELHLVTPATDDLSFLAPKAAGDSYLSRQLQFQREYYEWACEERPVPIVEEAFDVLSATIPVAERTVLNWGDSRIGNILYRDFEPVAVLDWEMATLGPPEVDLGWMTMMHAFFQGMAEQHGFPGLPDFLRRSRAVAVYEELSGHRLDDLAWYEALAALRFAIISIRTTLRSVAFGLQEAPIDPDGLVMFQPLLRRLLEKV